MRFTHKDVWWAAAAALLLVFTISEARDGPISNSGHQMPTFNVRDFGAKGDGKSKDTVAITKAIAAVEAAGGGEVYFPEGTYLTGSFNMTSNMTIWVDKGASLVGSPDFDDWHLLQAMPSYPVDKSKNSNPRYGSLVHGYRLDKVRILGSGFIDGQGPLWWSAYRGHKLSFSRPFLVEFMESTNIQIGNGITLTQSPFWTLHIYGCSNVLVSDYHVQNDLTAPNTDGVDIDSSSNVYVTNSTINTADDHIAIKSGYGSPGRLYGRASENITIAGNSLGLGAGIAIGSETAGSVRNVLIRKNTFSVGAANIVRMKGCTINGGVVENVEYSDMSATVTGTAILVDQMYECHPPPNATIPTIVRNIRLRNLSSSGALSPGKIHCVKEQPCQIDMENIKISYPIQAWSCANVEGHVQNVSPKPCYG